MAFEVGSSSALWCAAALGVAAIVLTVRRGPAAVGAFISAGIVILVLAAGNLSMMIPAAGRIAVMVDVSPSTRGAGFRRMEMLHRRLDQLLGNSRYNLVFFADRNRTEAIDEMPAERTVFAPPPCDAVVLFSDGRFSPPLHSPPVYPVLDPALESAEDAAIVSMQYVGDQLAVSVVNSGPPRTLRFHGTRGEATEIVDGSRTVMRPVDPAAARIWAELSPGDNWPENDAMSILPPPSGATERWWVGGGAPEGWRALAPQDVPTDPAAYLAPPVIVLNNVSADGMAIGALECLEEYVRDLGGSLVILGGDSAFAGGGYPGTILESLSPMSSSPPAPRGQWIILADASGSMAQPVAGGETRWSRVAGAVVNLLPHLPPADPVRVGQFSDDLRWWSEGKAAEATARLNLPPPDALPHGPTNLQPVLEAIAAAHSDLPTELVLLTDADVAIDDPPALARALKAARIRVHLLAIERGSGLAELEDIVRDTGGSFITQLDFTGWAEAVRRLVRGAWPDAVSAAPAAVQFIGPGAAIAGETAALTNSAWAKPDATAVARSGDRVLAATWHFGSGQVLAAAFVASPSRQTALADLIAQPPRDPRLKVSWQTNPTPRVSVDAVDGRTYLNKLNLTLEIWDEQTVVDWPIPQTGPGRYELALPFVSRPSMATVRQGDRIVDRFALGGGYPEEFAQIGEDRAALEGLAESTGGAVILPTQTTAIDFHWRGEAHPLTPWLAALGAMLLAAGLVLSRRLPRGSGSV